MEREEREKQIEKERRRLIEEERERIRLEELEKKRVSSSGRIYTKIARVGEQNLLKQKTLSEILSYLCFQ